MSQALMPTLGFVVVLLVALLPLIRDMASLIEQRRGTREDDGAAWLDVDI